MTTTPPAKPKSAEPQLSCSGAVEKPWHPYLVLLAAVVLPGVGHVLNGKPVKGLQFAFFIVLFGWLTTKIAPPEATFIGRHAGGVFVWCLSILDAYRSARMRWEAWRRISATPSEPPQERDDPIR